MKNAFQIYLSNIASDYKNGKATEHTYRSALENLIESLEPDVKASNDPKHVQCGAPDFVVERRKIPVGYVETKDIEDDLDKAEKGEQLKRYRHSLNNLILTDYLEFRWYVNGEKRMTARIASVGKDRTLVSDPDGLGRAEMLFNEFFRTEVPTVGTPKELASRMAALTKIIREMILGSIREEGETGMFHRQFAAFQEHLLPGLKRRSSPTFTPRPWRMDCSPLGPTCPKTSASTASMPRSICPRQIRFFINCSTT